MNFVKKKIKNGTNSTEYEMKKHDESNGFWWKLFLPHISYIKKTSSTSIENVTEKKIFCR